jgi:hypothetical protein
MVQITYNSTPELLRTLDEAAQERRLSRSRLITEIITAYFSPREPSDTEVLLLQKDIDNLNKLMAARDAEIIDLKELNGRLWSEWHDANTRLLQYQLPAPTPKKSWFARHFRNKE